MRSGHHADAAPTSTALRAGQVVAVDLFACLMWRQIESATQQNLFETFPDKLRQLICRQRCMACHVRIASHLLE
jgi:hypothetical protein